MRSEPASGATVTERFPPRPSAAASAGVITSAFSEVGDEAPADAPVPGTVVADRDEVAVLVVDRRIAARPVGPHHLLRPLEDRLAGEGTAEGAVEELAQHLLRLADQEEIDELGQRLGIEKRGRTPRDDERRVRAALPTAERDTGQTEAVEDVQVVALEGDRERHHVEVADGAVLLEGSQRARPRGAVAVGQEGAVAGDARILGQEPEHGLEAEVRHRDRIRVRVDEAYRQRTTRAGSEE